MHDATAALNRAANVRVANDLARSSGRTANPGHAGLGLELRTYRALTLPRTSLSREATGFLARRFSHSLSSLRNEPSAQTILLQRFAVGLEAVLTDQRADPRRFQLDRVERIEASRA
jgi:hypothetical protein